MTCASIAPDLIQARIAAFEVLVRRAASETVKYGEGFIAMPSMIRTAEGNDSPISRGLSACPDYVVSTASRSDRCHFSMVLLDNPSSSATSK